MLTDDQLNDQCNLIKKMLEVSPYYNDCNVIYTHHSDEVTIFVIDNCYWIMVQWNKHGLHQYTVGYYKEYYDGEIGNDVEEVVISYNKQSLYQCTVRIIKDMYANQLQIAMESWAEENAA